MDITIEGFGIIRTVTFQNCCRELKGNNLGNHTAKHLKLHNYNFNYILVNTA